MNLTKGLITLFGSISCFYFISCSCTSVDCDLDETNIYLRILSNVDSSDLVFGESKIYNRDKLEVFKLEASDTTFFNVKNVITTDMDSFLTFNH